MQARYFLFPTQTRMEKKDVETSVSITSEGRELRAKSGRSSQLDERTWPYFYK